MVRVNGIDYRKPSRPTVIVCMDGVAPEYLEEAGRAGMAPAFEKFKKEGFYSVADCVIPSFTNPNNTSIVTGVLPRVHGIATSGQSFNRKTGQYELICRPEDVACDTILKAFHENGLKVAAIASKDKLRSFLSKGWQGINISAEVAHKFEGDGTQVDEVIERAVEETSNGTLLEKVEDPDWMYSQKSAHFALDLAVAVLQGKGPYVPQLMYVSLTDYIPHRYEAGTEIANQFIQGIDQRLGEMDRMGCALGVTSDHGMSSKFNPDGSPDAIWLKDVLESHGIEDCHIVLPCADKYQGHHGSLGSAAWIYFDDQGDADKALEVLGSVQGVEEALSRSDVVERHGVPGEMIGDVFLLSQKNKVFGTTASEHPNAPTYLRSHGGLYEQKVPFVVNLPVSSGAGRGSEGPLRNFNIVDYAVNKV